MDITDRWVDPKVLQRTINHWLSTLHNNLHIRGKHECSGSKFPIIDRNVHIKLISPTVSIYPVCPYIVIPAPSVLNSDTMVSHPDIKGHCKQVLVPYTRLQYHILIFWISRVWRKI